MKKVLSTTLALIALSFTAYADNSIVEGSFKGRHGLFGKCSVEVQSSEENSEYTITVNKIKKDEVTLSRSFKITKDQINKDLEVSKYALQYKVYDRENFPTGSDLFYQCTLFWWAGGCSNPHTNYNIELDNDGKILKVESSRNRKEKDSFTCTIK